MALENWYVTHCTRFDIEGFIEKWHYSQSINGCIADYCFALYSPDKIMKGAMFFGKMAMANQWKRFSDNIDDVIELRRLACVDDTPKNAESFFIGKSLKLLSQVWGGNVVVSYADKEYGHEGTIYKASNFHMVGEIKGARVIVHNGKRHHDKTIRATYNGEIKPYALAIRDALDSGEAVYQNTAGKVTYVYKLNPKRRLKIATQQDLF
jgi:hypothetical protein